MLQFAVDLDVEFAETRVMPYSDMTAKRRKRPRDPMQLGRLIVDIATGQVSDQIDDERD
jgi:hypothetical protein